jgi:uncharacterized protein YdhG (YjbR/CyaY superfamily)
LLAEDRTTMGREGPVDTSDMDDGVRRYVDAIAPEHRPLFDRLHHLVLRTHPEAILVLSYRMPTYKVGQRKLHVGVWKHGLSIYGWRQGKEAAFVSRHPEARTSKGTIQLRPEDSAAITDEDLCGLVRAALDD